MRKGGTIVGISVYKSYNAFNIMEFLLYVCNFSQNISKNHVIYILSSASYKNVK